MTSKGNDQIALAMLRVLDTCIHKVEEEVEGQTSGKKRSLIRLIRQETLKGRPFGKYMAVDVHRETIFDFFHTMCTNLKYAGELPNAFKKICNPLGGYDFPGFKAEVQGYLLKNKILILVTGKKEDWSNDLG